jgi:uncharacterized protein (DUF1330 family)
MKTGYTVALSMLAGAALGATAIHGLHAQGKPPAYYVAEIEVSNDEIYMKEWTPKVAETIKAAGGTYIARHTSIQGFEGTPPKRAVISKFDNMDNIKAWRDSAGYKADADP